MRSVVGIGEAVYAFKDNRLAAFDTFAMLIPKTSSFNVDEFELLVGREASSGPFDSIGKFRTQNLRIFAAPSQTFTFPLVEAKYLKVKVIATHGGGTIIAYEFQLQELWLDRRNVPRNPGSPYGAGLRFRNQNSLF